MHGTRPRNTRILVLSHYDAVRLYGWDIIVLPDDRMIVVERYGNCKAFTSNNRELLVGFFKSLYPAIGDRYEEELRGYMANTIGFPVIATCNEMYHSEFMLVSSASPIASLSYTTSGNSGNEASEVTVYDSRRLMVSIGMGMAVTSEAYYLEGDKCIQADPRLGVRSGACPFEVYVLVRLLSGGEFKAKR